jgi:hypothetical protein
MFTHAPILFGLTPPPLAPGVPSSSETDSAPRALRPDTRNADCN